MAHGKRVTESAVSEPPGLRIAVALPSLPRTALHSRALENVLEALVRRGVQVEGFAEAGRAREGGCSFPLYHYLRLPERHAAAAFHTALYPLGRDSPPYEPAYVLLHRFPGWTWVLDPVAHHLLVGSIGHRGRWDAYRLVQEAAFGEVGAEVATTVASGW